MSKYATTDHIFEAIKQEREAKEAELEQRHNKNREEKQRRTISELSQKKKRFESKLSGMNSQLQSIQQRLRAGVCFTPDAPTSMLARVCYAQEEENAAKNTWREQQQQVDNFMLIEQIAAPQYLEGDGGNKILIQRLSVIIAPLAAAILALYFAWLRSGTSSESIIFAVVFEVAVQVMSVYAGSLIISRYLLSKTNINAWSVAMSRVSRVENLFNIGIPVSIVFVLLSIFIR
ncbi:MAG TPA: hypothetical protein ENJ30_02775 [Desulfobulbaceae bacterium]|nr:hypothetical protein [Desulfobulbaceae bacterium]